jgi:uncharacterized protein (DUF1697 family)
MAIFISILRGINVSGQKKILMQDLKALYEQLKFNTIGTYIQSGNVVFSTDKKTDTQKLSKEIEQAIQTKYQFDVPVIVRSLDQMQQIVTANPFLKEKNINPEKLHVTFLDKKPSVENIKNIESLSFLPDRFVLIETDVFLHCPDSYGDTKLSNKFFENKLKVQATTRNWKTVNKLLEMASA